MSSETRGNVYQISVLKGISAHSLIMCPTFTAEIHVPIDFIMTSANVLIHQLAECRSGSVPYLPCKQLGFVPRICLREIIPASNCTMREQNNWGNWGSPGVMKHGSGMGGAALTSGVPGVSKWRFLSEVGYATLPRFPHCGHPPR